MFAARLSLAKLRFEFATHRRLSQSFGTQV
jgi:hypothetical protein